MHFHLNGEGYLIAFVMLAGWTIFWSLVFARALKYVLRQRVLERALLERLTRTEREWAQRAASGAEPMPAISNEA
jgi:hypothetical protein